MVGPWCRAGLLVTGLLVAGCAQPGGSHAPRDQAGTWRQLPPPPLTPRQSAVTAWTGAEALFIGGDLGPPCPRNAACDRAVERARDGAAYDPARTTWRRIADPPLPVDPGSSAAVVADVVYVLGHDDADPATARLLSYDASEDAWASIDPPPDGLELVGLATDGTGLLTVRGERHEGDPPDQRYDPATRAWAPLPEDPLGPSFDRGYVSTPAGLVLTAKELVPNPGVEPALVRAAVLDPSTQRWSRLPDSEQVGGWRWTWTGRHLVDASVGDVDGGEVNRYDRSYPFGGVLDPFTGEWGPLPNAPRSTDGPAPGGWPVDAVGGRFTAAGGWIYDDRAETWTVLPGPDGGPTTPGSALWAGERLVVLGGVDYASGENGVLTEGAWLYTPGRVDDQPVAPAVDQGIVGDWELVDGTSAGRPLPSARTGRATLSADDRQVTGTAFCNGYGGHYRLDGDRVLVQDVASTSMACLDPDLMQGEAAFLTVLTAEGTSFTRTTDELVLENPAGRLRFRPQTPVPTAELVGTRWVLDTLIDGETASSTVGEPATLELGDDGTFTASTGCRPLSGTWRATGDTVYVDYQWPEASCAPDVEGQEQQVIAALGNGFRPVVEGQRLTVTGRDGSGLVYRAG